MWSTTSSEISAGFIGGEIVLAVARNALQMEAARRIFWSSSDAGGEEARETEMAVGIRWRICGDKRVRSKSGSNKDF